MLIFFIFLQHHCICFCVEFDFKSAPFQSKLSTKVESYLCFYKQKRYYHSFIVAITVFCNWPSFNNLDILSSAGTDAGLQSWLYWLHHFVAKLIAAMVGKNKATHRSNWICAAFKYIICCNSSKVWNNSQRLRQLIACIWN